MTVVASFTQSSYADTAGYSNMGLIVPPELDGTQISFQVSINTTTFFPLYDITNTPVVMTVAPSRAYDLPGELSAWRYISIVTLTTQTTTNTVFQLVLRS